MQNKSTSTRPSTLLVAMAFATIYLVWGSTYLVILFAIETIPPFLMAGIRFLFAGLLLRAIVSWRKPQRPTLANWKAAAVVGCLMLVGGNGMVSWSEQYVPSGLAALMIATVPLWIVLLDWLFFAGPKPSRRILLGLAIGLIGLAILIGPSNLGGERINLYGAAALMFACVAWSIGSLRSRHAELPSSPFLATAMEMTAAGVALLLLSAVTGEWSHVDATALSYNSVLCVAYLSIFGSIIALTAYTWLLKVSTPAKAATYAYVNPVVAMFLGFMFADEVLSPRIVAAAAVILVAVVLITTAKQKHLCEGVKDSEPDGLEAVERVTRKESAIVNPLTQSVVQQIRPATCCQNE